MGIIEEIEKKQKNDKVASFNVGDTVKVFSKIVEGSKERLQAFEGIVIKKKGGSNRETFTVRKLVQGVGVERIFPLHSPKIDNVQVIKRGRVRRAKLYYLRNQVGSAATKIKEEAKKTSLSGKQ
ncbi:50S ribosomal protein L19 [candidate division WOR-1 bacterium RIFOXYD2_FULL_36_8]|uniref:Large ribosomal subunit protein bL19 n=1 Tax=candidate division WOR-1 bacterium RIFOXYB2_FULL_36_35 TaxID=1802578 RepID=A0A1F4S0L2_UNCSA|nr:MAG: 50S ribosomal protein L19 [candidate division WOR-1 bacterium RIFOXYA2_FULL_36_21]OGC13971.1 MAG: 50S ribosomal protein L19 [candidate division WOR-1 bacterium RIFOXYB2_FULL_36_35]OGC18798.1 MAG: 50S ribosomal protein L19 [candidate division WOR-1 bacterium RIFOXYA12_FULL_36_13]OGC41207.1 MAG: 50S ribosomal protein L19 [candidate division WOR-1 bacterium RIFOXYD2_FULL_36_8]